MLNLVDKRVVRSNPTPSASKGGISSKIDWGDNWEYAINPQRCAMQSIQPLGRLSTWIDIHIRTIFEVWIFKVFSSLD